jgi:hypothetical protein
MSQEAITGSLNNGQTDSDSQNKNKKIEQEEQESIKSSIKKKSRKASSKKKDYYLDENNNNIQFNNSNGINSMITQPQLISYMVFDINSLILTLFSM